MLTLHLEVTDMHTCFVKVCLCADIAKSASTEKKHTHQQPGFAEAAETTTHTWPCSFRPLFGGKKELPMQSSASPAKDSAILPD